jgi:hypothetical protein
MSSKTPAPDASPNPVVPERTSKLTVTVHDAGGRKAPIANAWVAVYEPSAGQEGKKFDARHWLPRTSATPLASGRTLADGSVSFDALPSGESLVFYGHYPETPVQAVALQPGCEVSVCLEVEAGAELTTVYSGPDCQPLPCARPRDGDQLLGSFEFNNSASPELLRQVQLVLPAGAKSVPGEPRAFVLPLRAGTYSGVASLRYAARAPEFGGSGNPARLDLGLQADVDERAPTPISGTVNVALSRTETAPTSDLKLWGAIKRSSEQLAFTQYDSFMEQLFCDDGRNAVRPRERARYDQLLTRRFLPFTDTDAYRVMKAATEAFVMVNCGVLPDADDGSRDGGLGDFSTYLQRRDLPHPGRAPYLENVNGVQMLPYLAIIRRKLPDVPLRSELAAARNGDIELCDVFIEEKLRLPCLMELIWSYWQEEGMLVQSLNAISRRFQNVRGSNDPDPLVNLEVNPLRPLNSLLWGYVQDEQHRLTVARRNGEYDHHYGLRLEGRAVQGFRGADTRSKFIEAFHHLLRLCVEFYKQDDDTTVRADAFGVLNALKEVHLILSQGAHSQFGELPPTARTEMMMQQWLLARPEFREFLPTRSMVPYPEAWMDRVDAMKKLMGWTETSVIHFHNLAVFGEQLLLAIRYGAWSTVFEPVQAFNFARFWRPQVQGYIHAYRAATGVELGATAVTQQVDTTLPSLLLQRRLSAQRRSA